MTEYYTYITKDNDRWDLISYKFYKTPNLYEEIIKANPKVPITPTVKAGIKLKIPILEESKTIKLLKITDTDSFEEYSTFCDHNESIQYIKDIELSKRTPNKMNMDESFKNYCILQANGLYDFNLILKMCEKLKCKSTKLSIKNIDAIKIVKANKDSIYIEITDDKAELNNKELKKGFYKISFGFIDRSSNNGTEYFMQKDLISYIPDKNIVLKTKLKEIIEKYLI